MLTRLFHITHIDNLPSIEQRGLLCRHSIEGWAMSYINMSDPNCQARRTDRVVASSHVDLHHYVPLFFNARNPMLWRLWRTMSERGEHDRLAILEISAEPACWGASLVADGIASSHHTRVLPAKDHHSQSCLDWAAIYRADWRDAPRELKRKTMSEVLVHGSLHCRHICKVWLQKPSALRRLTGKLPQRALACCQVDQQGEVFFHD